MTRTSPEELRRLTYLERIEAWTAARPPFDALIEQTEEITRIGSVLAATAEGRAVLTELMAHENSLVRAFAAAHSLSWNEELAWRTLGEVRAEGRAGAAIADLLLDDAEFGATIHVAMEWLIRRFGDAGVVFERTRALLVRAEDAPRAIDACEGEGLFVLGFDLYSEPLEEALIDVADVPLTDSQPDNVREARRVLSEALERTAARWVGLLAAMRQ